MSSEFGIQKANDFCTECIKNKILNVSPLHLVILSILKVPEFMPIKQILFQVAEI